MVMVLDLVIQVPIVVPLFQMDGLQTVMILSQTVQQMIQMSVVFVVVTTVFVQIVRVFQMVIM